MMFYRARMTPLNRALLLPGMVALWAVLLATRVEDADDLIVK
jgi:hypothetical protein